MNDPFRQAGGSRRVHDVEHVVVTGRARRLFGRPVVTERFVALGEVGNLLRPLHLQPVPDVGALPAGMKLGNRVHKILVEDQPGGPTVLENELELVGH